MRLVALVVVCGLIAGPHGAAPRRFHSAQRTTGSVLSALARRATGELPVEEAAAPCLSLRENEEQRPLLCTDRRSKFNFNPFGLRFGRRGAPRRAAQRARAGPPPPLSLRPPSLFSR